METRETTPQNTAAVWLERSCGRSFLALALLVACNTQCLWVSVAKADPLLGDAMAAYSTAEASDANPANAAFLEQSQVVYISEAIRDEQIKVRYPGFDPITISNSGFTIPITKPAFIYKITPRIGVGGFFVPAIPVTVNLKKPKIPVVILGAQNFLDLSVSAKVQGVGGATFGYRINDRLGVGLGATYQAAQFAAKMTSSSDNSLLADVDGSGSQTSMIVGLRAVILPNILQIGIAADVYSQQKVSLNIKSPLLEGTGVENGLGNSGDAFSGSKSFSSILVGGQLGLGQRVRILTDLRHSRVDKSQTGFSLVSLKQAKQDLYDTTSVRAGAIVSAMPRLNLLMGIHAEPSNIGPGKRGDDPLIGFGTINLVQIMAGLAPLTPYTMVAAGLQLGLVAKSVRKPQMAHGREKGYYQLVLEGGVTYTYSSLGIDSSGELPGAYLYRKVGVPLGFIYRF